MTRTLALYLALGMAYASAAEPPGIKLRIDTRILEVGEAVDVQLVCTNTGMPTTPQAAIPDGLDLQLLSSTPSHSSQMSIINGRTWQESSYVYSMRLVGVKAGHYKLGPVSVEADGRTYKTEPIEIVVKKTTPAAGRRGDMDMFVEIAVEPTSLYVTETYTASLTIGVRKVVIRGRVYDLDLLTLLDRNSQLSIFRDRYTASDRTLTDSRGLSHEYTVYRVEKRIRAEEVGETLVGPVFLKMDYPTELRRGFFRSLEVARSRRITARADAVAVEVKAPPETGRPAEFSGAIGRFTMEVKAKPLRVEQNQPVTLTIVIKGSPISGVAGPDLSRQAELASRFEFIKDELVGELEGGGKVFRRAIFPRQQGEQTIPPITWSYFDPKREQYVSITSDAIPLTVDPPSASTVAVLPGNATQTEPTLTPLTLLTGGISPNYVEPVSVLADHSLSFATPYAVGLVAPPVAWVVLALVAGYRTRLKTDTGFARRRGARRRAASRVAQALRNGTPSAQLEGLARALTTYLSDRFDLPPGRLTPSEVRDLLTARSVDTDMVDAVTSFLEMCDAARYAPSVLSGLSITDASTRIRGWIKRIEGTT
ncbi:MAG: BatD family protein [Phycisphaerae bacterium]